MNSQKPIGIFDSGVGGLTVLSELQAALPFESMIYLADQKNCPYGNKTAQEIIDLSVKNVEFLLNKDCKLIVLACNTATTAAIEFLRSNYHLPFVGMEPAVKPAALNSKTGHVGVLATQGTIRGRMFKETSQKFAGGVEVHVQIGDGLVELAERGELDSERTMQLLESYIRPMLDCNVDHIVLGCTHYPLFIPLIKKIIGNKCVEILNAAPAVARRVSQLLRDNKMLNQSGRPGQYKFYPSEISQLASKYR